MKNPKLILIISVLLLFPGSLIYQDIQFDMNLERADTGYPEEHTIFREWFSLMLMLLSAIETGRVFEGFPKSIEIWQGLSFSEPEKESESDNYISLRELPDALQGVPDGTVFVKPPEPDMEKEVLEIVNRERTKYGLNPIVWDDDLAFSARYHAADMALFNYFDHDSHDRDRSNDLYMYVILSTG